MKRWKHWLPFPFLCAALVLMILPLGNLLVFAPGPDERLVTAFSWFDGTAWGYGHFAPLAAAVLATVSFVLLPVFCLTGRCGTACQGVLTASAILAVLAFLTANAWNGWGAATAGLLVLAAVMQALIRYWENRKAATTCPEKEEKSLSP